MNKTKKLMALSVITILSITDGIIGVIHNPTVVEAQGTSDISEIETTLSQVDNTQWQYNEEDNVYWQIGISYAATPEDAEQATLGIFVPGEYMTAIDNGDGTYTCEINYSATVGNYTAATAPIVIPINTPGYSAMEAPSDYVSEAATYTQEGMIYVSAGARGRTSGAPAGVTDFKAAIRYLRYNEGNIAGNMNAIYVFGMSGGGAQASVLGASGDSDLYTPYLEAIGAVQGVSDAVNGVMAWCPITNLDTADAAYEWNLGASRSDLDESEQVLSDALATTYADYINSLQITDEEGNILMLSESEEGIYQSGTYYDYVKSVIEESLNTFLETTTFPYVVEESNGGMGGGTPTGTPPSDDDSKLEEDTEVTSEQQEVETTSIEDVDQIQRVDTSSGITLSGTYDTVQDYIDALNAETEWVLYNAETNKVSITSVEEFVVALKTASKSLTAFDALDESQGENELFGVNGTTSHFDIQLATLLDGTEYEADFEEDLSQLDELGTDMKTRVEMYTPLYYLLQYYDGYQTATVAENWRIHSGINQGDTSLTTEINLALALQQYGIENVEFATIWGQAHTTAEIGGASNATQNFIDWVKEATQ